MSKTILTYDYEDINGSVYSTSEEFETWQGAHDAKERYRALNRPDIAFNFSMEQIGEEAYDDTGCDVEVVQEKHYTKDDIINIILQDGWGAKEIALLVQELNGIILDIMAD